MFRKLFSILAGCLFLVAILSVADAAIIEVGGDVSGEAWVGGNTYHVIDNLTVGDGKILTIEAGAVVKFNPGLELTVYGTLDVNGVDGNPVVFTSRDDNTSGESVPGSDGDPDPGDWYGILLYEGIGQFDWCRIRYGGNAGSQIAANVYFRGSNSSHLTNSIIEDSGCYGVRVNYEISPKFRGNRIENNTSYGILIDGGGTPDLGSKYPEDNPDKGRNTIRNNDSGNYQVYNGSSGGSSGTINAYYNFWGYTTHPPDPTTAQAIDAHIYDNEEGGGEVFFNPWLTEDQSLPVMLSRFTAMARDVQVILAWRTESEVGNVGFAIYRSEAKNGNYAKIAFVDGAGNSAMPTDYKFCDKQVQPGHTYYYYLEDVDITRKRSKSDVIQITINSRGVVPSFALLFASI